MSYGRGFQMLCDQCKRLADEFEIRMWGICKRCWEKDQKAMGEDLVMDLSSRCVGAHEARDFTIRNRLARQIEMFIGERRKAKDGYIRTYYRTPAGRLSLDRFATIRKWAGKAAP